MSDRTKSIIGFDFDGVVIDSIQEVLRCAHLAAELGLHPTDEYRKNFLEYRYQIQQAGDFIPFAHWCNNPEGDPMSVVTTCNEPRKHRSAKFFSARGALARELGDEWLKLHQPFQKIKDLMLKLSRDDYVVITHKNRAAVLKLANHLELPIEDTRLYTGDCGKQKSEHLRDLYDSTGGRRIMFVDDSIKNLLEVKTNFPFASLFLATWGYVGPEDTKTASKYNLRFGDEDAFISFIASKGFSF